MLTGPVSGTPYDNLTKCSLTSQLVKIQKSRIAHFKAEITPVKKLYNRLTFAKYFLRNILSKFVKENGDKQYFSIHNDLA